MKGKILDFNFQSGEGVISGNDGNRYGFMNTEWRSHDIHPAQGVAVDFEARGDGAFAIYAETPFKAIANDYENSMIEAFVNKPEKTAWYQNAFKAYQINGVDKMAWQWSWWAFFGGALFLLYRKAYLAALVYFLLSLVLSFIPFAGLIFWIISGGYATYFVYKKYKAKKEEIERTIADTQQRIETMRVVGGYNTWVIWVYAVFFVLTMIGIVAAVLVPMMAMQHSY